MPMISSRPASGMLKLRQRGGDDHERGPRHAGHALAGQHQHQQHGDLLGQGELDVVGLGDEDDREGAVHHRSVEVERVAERQHEADDLLGHADTWTAAPW